MNRLLLVVLLLLVTLPGVATAEPSLEELVGAPPGWTTSRQEINSESFDGGFPGFLVEEGGVNEADIVEGAIAIHQFGSTEQERLASGNLIAKVARFRDEASARRAGETLRLRPVMQEHVIELEGAPGAFGFAIDPSDPPGNAEPRVDVGDSTILLFDLFWVVGRDLVGYALITDAQSAPEHLVQAVQWHVHEFPTPVVFAPPPSRPGPIMVVAVALAVVLALSVLLVRTRRSKQTASPPNPPPVPSTGGRVVW